MGTWDIFVAVGTIVGFIAAFVEIARGRKMMSLLLVSFVGALGLLSLLLLVDNARKDSRNDAVTDIQARARYLIESWRNTGSGFSTDFNTPGENRAVVVAAADFLLDFRDCRPEAYERLNRVFEDAQRETIGVPDYDSSLPQDASNVWASAAETAYGQVEAISRVSPNCP